VDLYDLPNGWEWFLIDQIGEIVTGNTPSKKREEYYGNDFPFFKPSDLNNGYYVERAEDNLSNEGIKKARLLPEKSILVTCIGATISKTGFIRVKGACNQQINAIVPHKKFFPEYIYFWCISTIFKNTLITESSSTTLPILNKGRFSSLHIPIAPLNEQKRIVEKIELIQERTRKVKNELDNIKVKLKRLRRSLLASAFRGDLTKDWRADHPDIESATVLLERIKKERREKWEQAELEKMRVKGITPKDDKWKSKYSEPQSVKNIDDLPNIPNGWCWVTLDTIMTKIVDGTHHTPDYTNQGIAFLSVKDIKNNEISFDECKYISPDTHKELSKRCCPKLGDLLITKSGTIGRCAVVKTDRPFNLFVSVALLQPFNNTIDSNFVSLSFQSWFQTIDVQNNITGSTIKNFHLIDFKKLAIKFAPLEEQKEIVRKLEKMMQFADRVEERVKEAEKKLDKFNQSVLAKAFRGKLVPQDPNDEPASVLLGKIQQEKNSTTSKKIKK